MSPKYLFIFMVLLFHLFFLYDIEEILTSHLFELIVCSTLTIDFAIRSTSVSLFMKIKRVNKS